ncbi:MAG: hypothetical protein ACRBBS_14605 [Thalassovita sp.]
MTDNHDHDLGFAHDLPKMIGRRKVLTVLGGLGVASLSGLPAAAAQCIALPWETAGPYPGDGSNARRGQTVNTLIQEGVIRQDLRSSFGTFTGEVDGVALDLELTLTDAEDCTPLAGHAIYVWHCDTTGNYSMYDLPEANFLRGVGVADANGKVRFTTIFPGCYDGRWPHIHFEIFTSPEAAVSGEASVLTAQMAFRQADAAKVYAADARYSNGTRNLGRITLASDNVFADNTADQIAQQTIATTGDPTSGYQGTLTIPVDFMADRTVSMAPPPAGGVRGFFQRLLR